MKNEVLEVEASLVGIDRDRLDQEWVEHPEKYLDYALQEAEANHDVLELKAAFDVAEAEAEKDIRTRPRKFRLKIPIREASIKLAIVLHPRVKKAIRRLNTAKHRAGILGAAVKAFDHKKRALEKLVDLHGQGYFAAPRMPKDEFTSGINKPRKKKRVSG